MMKLLSAFILITFLVASVVWAFRPSHKPEAPLAPQPAPNLSPSADALIKADRLTHEMQDPVANLQFTH